MVVTIHVNDAMTNDELVDFLSSYDYELLTRRASATETVFTCTPTRDNFTPDDLAYEMEEWLYVEAKGVDDKN